MMQVIKYSFLLFSLSFISCRDDKGPTISAALAKGEVACQSDTIKIVSFSKNVLPIFTANCSIAGCHSGSSPAANLNLTASVAYSQLMQKGSGYVDTTNPNYSVLYSQMNSVSSPMPPTGKLDTCTINMVYKWIQQKAKNN